MLRTSCIAINKYSIASSSAKNNFPFQLDTNFIYQLPALIIPILSNNDFERKQNLLVKTYAPLAQIVMEKENVFKLLTEEDEVYLTLLGRGDFNKDGFEDLLIQSEWYARKAHGKYVDLLILSK